MSMNTESGSLTSDIKNIDTVDVKNFTENFLHLIETYSSGPENHFTKLNDSIKTKIVKEANLKDLRNSFMMLFQLSEFREIYEQFFRNFFTNNNIENGVFQIQPTPRIVLPNSLATSFHCDKWYGHGSSTYTIWVPLHDIEKGSGVYFIEDDVLNAELQKEFTSAANYSKALKNFNDRCSKLSKQFLPKKGTAKLFHSSVTHGSLLNTASTTRFSIDFRFSSNSKDIGNKSIYDFCFLSSDKTKSNVFPNNLRVLKYINGETGLSTKSQHLLIESFCSASGLIINGQEAEIENGQKSVLKHYSDKKNLDKSQFDAIVIASKSLLTQDCIDIANNSESILITALEQEII